MEQETRPLSRSKPHPLSEPLTEESRIELLTETLVLWHGLFAGDRWTDPKAQNVWNESGLPKLDLPTRGDDDGTSFGGPGRKAAMEAYHAKLRPHAEQRVKQLASRITEAAVGIGRIKSRHIAEGAARPTSRVDAPCHAVVIESLTNYRPDELQTRRENRQLMEWSSAKVQKYLAESCQLHGLHLREVQPNYTSRQRRQLRPRRPTRH